MATTCSIGAIQLVAPWSYVLTAKPNNIPFNGPWTYSGASLTQGTGAGQADLVYAAQIVLAASGTHTTNLSSVTDEFGNSISFARLKCLYVENNSATTSTNVEMGNAGVTPFAGIWSPGTATISIRNATCYWSGICQDATGWVVGTGVNLLFTNSDNSNSATLNLLIGGCSV